MPDIVISEFMSDLAVARLAGRYDTLYDPGFVDRPEELLEAVREARVLITRNRTQVRGALLDQAVRLVCVGRLGVGLDNIDIDACRARGIAVYPASGANDLSVAEYVITAALSLLRGAWFFSADVAAGLWPRQRLIGRELAGRTMGLVGYGAIAREVAWRAQALRMHVVAHDPHVPASDAAWRGVRNLPLDVLLASADVVSLHVPLTSDTWRMIGPAQLAGMKKSAILVNAARGGVVDEAALAAALREGRIGGAALDVFETEPLTADAGAIFAGVPNLVLTPHIAGVTEESNERVSELVTDRIVAHLEQA